MSKAAQVIHVNAHRQGRNLSNGEDPQPSEVLLWRATYIVREVIITAPDDMTIEETQIYFDSLVHYLVCRQNLSVVWRVLTLPP